MLPLHPTLLHHVQPKGNFTTFSLIPRLDTNYFFYMRLEGNVRRKKSQSFSAVEREGEKDEITHGLKELCALQQLPHTNKVTVMQ